MKALIFYKARLPYHIHRIRIPSHAPLRLSPEVFRDAHLEGAPPRPWYWAVHIPFFHHCHPPRSLGAHSSKCFILSFSQATPNAPVVFIARRSRPKPTAAPRHEHIRTNLHVYAPKIHADVEALGG